MESHSLLTAPRIRHEETTGNMMKGAFFLLSPVLIWSGVLYGLRVFVIAGLSVLFCLFFDVLFLKMRGRTVPKGDFSAGVTGLVLSLFLPVTVPYWLLFFFAFVAMGLGKHLFGGLGKNFMNPALLALAAGRLLFWEKMKQFLSPGSYYPSFWRVSLSESEIREAMALSPLEELASGKLPGISLQELLFGIYPGGIGTVPALILLTAFLFLLLKKTVTPTATLAYLGTFSLFSLASPLVGENGVAYLLYALFSGGVLLPALFSVNDPVTSPMTFPGKLVFGTFCGAAHYFLCREGYYLEAPIFAPLLGNLLVRPLDRLFRPIPYGCRLIWLERGKRWAKEILSKKERKEK